MLCPSYVRQVKLFLIFGGILLCNSNAQATGRWNLPSTVPQFFGYGNGPGYHAPRVRFPGHYPAKVPRVVKMSSQGRQGVSEYVEAMHSSAPACCMNTSTSPTTLSTPMVPEPIQPTASLPQIPSPTMDLTFASQESDVDPREHVHLLIRLPAVVTNNPATRGSTESGAQSGLNAMQSPIQELQKSWLTPVPLPTVAELPAATELIPESTPLISLPPVTLLPEVTPSDQRKSTEEVQTDTPELSLESPLFAAPPLSGLPR